MRPNTLCTLVPSLPAESFGELSTLAEKLAGVAAGFQIDIVDGVFAPHVAWPFTEPDVVSELQKIHTLPQSFALELDCMVTAPEQYLEVFLTLPLATIILHLGSTNAYDLVFDSMRERGVAVGLAFTNDADIAEVETMLPKLDCIQIMGIKTVGQQGQPFDERTLATAAHFHKHYPELFIAVDGSVNAQTIPSLMAAGVNHFAPGSAISKASNPVVAYKQLVSLLQ